MAILLNDLLIEIVGPFRFIGLREYDPLELSSVYGHIDYSDMVIYNAFVLF